MIWAVVHAGACRGPRNLARSSTFRPAYQTSTISAPSRASTFSPIISGYAPSTHSGPRRSDFPNLLFTPLPLHAFQADPPAAGLRYCISCRKPFPPSRIQFVPPAHARTSCIHPPTKSRGPSAQQQRLIHRPASAGKVPLLHNRRSHSPCPPESSAPSFCNAAAVLRSVS